MKYSITIRFYEELNDFLPKAMRKRDIDYSFPGRRSIKDLVESMGVPHVEVDLILVNGESVDFGYIVRAGDRISVYPVFESFSIKEVTHLREKPLRDIKFVLDVHLGKLARRMRLLGLDTDFRMDRDDGELADISAKTNRILLTRDVELLKRKQIERGIFVRNTDPDKQIIEIINKFDLRSFIKPFERCIECNGKINKLNYEDNIGLIKEKVPPGVLSWCTEFYSCSSCDKIYWKGSHYDKLVKIINNTIYPDI